MRLTNEQARRLGLGQLPSVKPRRPRAVRQVTSSVESPGPGRWVLTLGGWRPTPDNQLVYVPWWLARKRKRTDAETLTAAAILHGIPRATGKRRMTLTVRGPFRTWPDQSAYLKSFWDGAVAAGLIRDDSAEWLEFDWPPVYGRQAEWETIIELQDIDA